jgi:CDP-diacylglycerol--glycerol-3-phosphate 3-phosphatidyltransferase
MGGKPTMVSMLQASLRAPVTKIITPLCRALLRIGISANAMTVLGSFATLITSFYFFSQGKFFIGSIVVTLIVLTDLLDGTLARLSPKGPSTWGALLDSTLDRLGDSVIIGSILYWLIAQGDSLVPLALISLVSGGLVSYVKARAESLDIPCNGGLAERTERLIILLLSVGLHGSGVPFVLAIGLWILALVSTFTVAQRLLIVYRATQ